MSQPELIRGLGVRDATALLANTLVTSRIESLFGLLLIATGLPVYARLKRTRQPQ